MGQRERLAGVRAAERSSRAFRKIFGQLGTQEHPRGRVLVAYRNAHRALRDVYRRRATLWRFEVEEVLTGFRREVLSAAVHALGQGVEVGTEQARAELQAWMGEAGVVTLPPDFSAALQAWMAELDWQVAGVRAVVASGSDDVELIVGGGDRSGFLQPGPVVRGGARWVVSVAGDAWLGTIGSQVPAFEWYKQAVAAIDERTTDCCLRVHGQAVRLDEQFRLTGTPRFADRLAWSPFHWYCRTSVVLVPADEVEDELTRRMRTAAEAELARRAVLLAQIDEVKEALERLGAVPDVRRRTGDSAEVQRLRDELRRLREELGAEQHPASGVGG